MRPCTSEDFYPSKSVWVEHWPYIASMSMCIQNSEDITLYGNGYNGEFVSLDIGLLRCHNKTSCKNETEINDFLDKNGHLVYFLNGVDYKTEVYSEQVI